MIEHLEAYASFCYPNEPLDSLTNYLTAHSELRTTLAEAKMFKPLNEWAQNYPVTGGGSVTIGKTGIGKPVQILGMHVTDTCNELAAGFIPYKQTVVGAQIGSMLYECKAAEFTVVGPKIVNNPPVWNFISGCIKHIGNESKYISWDLIDKLAGLK